MSVEMKDDEHFLDTAAAEAVDNICRDLLKFETDRVLEDFEAVIKLASGHALNPCHLKKWVRRIVREADRKMIRNGCCSEEVFDVYTEEEELTYMAGTQAKLSNKLESLVAKAQSRISAAGVNYRKEVREAVEYIERHVTERITLSGIARHVSLNNTYLCRVFKEDTGKSIVSYINEMKMKKAYGLLKKGDKMIKEAAAAVGIDDQFYFNRLFKKVYGITPREIKKR